MSRIFIFTSIVLIILSAWNQPVEAKKLRMWDMGVSGQPPGRTSVDQIVKLFAIVIIERREYFVGFQ